MLRMLFLKGGSGSGNFGHSGRPGQVGGSAKVERLPDGYESPSSAHIVSDVEAKAYWDAHLSGKRVRLAVKLNGREHALTVDLRRGSHAWTCGERDAPSGSPIVAHDGGPRCFDAARAQLMDRLLPTLARPWRVVDGGGEAQVYVNFRRLGKEHRYVVVLKPAGDPRGSEWVFTSAHIEPDAVSHRTPVLPGKLQKAQTPGLSDPGFGTRRRNDEGSTPTPPKGDARCATPEGHAGFGATTYVAAFYHLFKAPGPSERWITIGDRSSGRPDPFDGRPPCAGRIMGQSPKVFR